MSLLRNFSSFSLAVILTISAACSTSSIAPPSGQIVVVQLTPEPGSTLSEASVIESTLEYQLTNMVPGATYEISPMFSDNRGAGGTLGAVRSMSELVTVTEPSGRVEIRRPIASAWNNPRLGRPIEMWFYIIETHGNRSVVVAKAGPFRY